MQNDRAPCSGGFSCPWRGVRDPCSPPHVRRRHRYGDILFHPFTEPRAQVHCVKTLPSCFPTVPSVNFLLEDLELRDLFLKIPEVAGSPLKLFVCKSRDREPGSAGGTRAATGTACPCHASPSNVPPRRALPPGANGVVHCHDHARYRAFTPWM